ncbi:MAG: hypothetical protein NT038_08445 [Euryarchaeota archaeon]|nr:hypothetical protein [Euryarchaeota archaeon]
MLVPSISAVEYKTVIDTNKSRLLNEIKSTDIDALELRLKSINNPALQEKLQKIDFQKLKQSSSSGYIDFEMLFTIFMLLLSTVIRGRPTLLSLYTNILLVLAFLSEFSVGSPYLKCHSIHMNFFLSFFSVLMAIESKLLIPNNMILAIIIILITYMIGSVIAYTLANAIGNSNSPTPTTT